MIKKKKNTKTNNVFVDGSISSVFCLNCSWEIQQIIHFQQNEYLMTFICVSSIRQQPNIEYIYIPMHTHTHQISKFLLGFATITHHHHHREEENTTEYNTSNTIPNKNNNTTNNIKQTTTIRCVILISS